MDITSYLLGKNASGGGGGGSTPKTVTDINNMLVDFDNYLQTLVNNYTAYTNEAITIYTPDADSTNFMIQKRSNGKYRIVWSNNAYYLCLISNSQQGFCSNRAVVGAYPVSNPITLSTSNPAGTKGYYSGEFDTLESLLLAIQNSNGSGISYTSYGSGLIYSGVLDENWISPISNLPVFQSDLETPFINGRVLSHNTTISVIG